MKSDHIPSTFRLTVGYKSSFTTATKANNKIDYEFDDKTKPSKRDLFDEILYSHILILTSTNLNSRYLSFGATRIFNLMFL